MIKEALLTLRVCLCGWTIAGLITCVSANAQVNYQIIFNGIGSNARLTRDSAGNLYGTYISIAYELSPGAGGSWTWKMLSRIPDGPYGALIFDKAGNLYGTTAFNSAACSCGTLFELIHNPDGTWTEKTLYTFTGGTDGAFPYADLVMDSGGNLYGAASQGGSGHHGVVFEFTPNGDGTWTEHILYSFTGGSDGNEPFGKLTFHNGILYGTTASNVFSLRKVQNRWTEKVLYTFKGGTDGISSYAGVIFDPAGNIYGTTRYGGNHGCFNQQGCGTVFRLKPNSNGTWSETVLYRFQGGSDGADPDLSALVRDGSGNLYGTTVFGGDNPVCIGGDCGTAFELTPGLQGTWTETVLHRFGSDNGDGNLPNSGMIRDSANHLFGATSFGGQGNAGVVFEITP